MSITTDAWTCIRQNHCMGLTAHFINPDMDLCAVVLECRPFKEKSSAINIANGIGDILERWSITNKVMAITTDNASYMGVAANILKIPHIP